MESKTLERFKQLLEAERERVETNSKNAVNELVEKTTATSGDEADEAAALSETHLALRFRDRERQLLGKINAALEKLRNGTFGECEDCGEDIGIRRLETRPMAVLCIGCKEVEERKERTYAET